MTKKTTIKVTCDGCGKDISETDSTPKYRLMLQSEHVPHNTLFINAVKVYPHINQPKHFCEIRCLKDWVNL